MNTDVELDELDDLIGAVREGIATDEQMAALSQRLTKDPAARRYYAEQSYLTSMLGNEFSEAAPPMESLETLVEPQSATEPKKRQLPPLLIFALGAAAAALLALAFWPAAPAQPAPTVAKAPSEDGQTLTDVAVGGTVRWTEDAVWQFETDYSQGGQVPAGMALGLSRGRVLIELSPTVQILASGATKFEIVSERRLRLFEGDLGVLVKGGDGIVCEVPGGEVRDIGTEFSLQARNGTVLAHVFEGSIEAQLQGIAKTTTAAAGQALRIDATAGEMTPSNKKANALLRISTIAGSSITTEYDYAESVAASGSTRYWSFANVSGAEDAEDPIRGTFRLRDKTWLKALPSGNNVLATYEHPKRVRYPLHASALDELNGTSFAVEFWFNQHAGARTRSTILACSTAKDPWRHHLVVQAMRTTPKTALRVAATYRVHSEDPGIQLLTPSTFTTDAWHHVVICRQDRKLALFVDGKLRSQHVLDDEAGIPPGEGSRKLLVGHMDDQGGEHQYWYSGYVDEIALYPNGLSDQSVREHFNKGAKLFPGL